VLGTHHHDGVNRLSSILNVRTDCFNTIFNVMSIDTKRWGKIAGILKENMWDATTDALQRDCRCESCGKIITQDDIDEYEAEGGEGCPAVCTDCADEEARLPSSGAKHMWESFSVSIMQEAPYIYKPFKSTAPAPMCQACGNELTYRDRVEYENEGGEGWPELCSDCTDYKNPKWAQTKKSIEEVDEPVVGADPNCKNCAGTGWEYETGQDGEREKVNCDCIHKRKSDKLAMKK